MEEVTGSSVPSRVALTGPISPTPRKKIVRQDRSDEDNGSQQKVSRRIQIRRNCPWLEKAAEYKSADEHAQSVDSDTAPVPDQILRQEGITDTGDGSDQPPHESFGRQYHRGWVPVGGNEKDACQGQYN